MMLWYVTNFCMVLLLIFMPGCGRAKKCRPKTALHSNFFSHSASLCAEKSNYAASKNKKHSSIEIFQQEAKLSDIPISIYARLVDNSAMQQESVIKKEDEERQDQAIQLHYESFVSLSELSDFYIQQMEMLDWQQVMTFCADELLFIFQKPGRTCAVSMRQRTKKITDLFIFVSQVS